MSDDPADAVASDLRFAAELFLTFPGSRARDGEGPANVGAQAIARIADALAVCDPALVEAIREAVSDYRRGPSASAHIVVVDAVTGAGSTPSRREVT